MYVNDDGRVERMVGAVYSIDDLSAASDALNDLRRSESEISADML
jgi:hypothetical protein